METNVSGSSKFGNNKMAWLVALIVLLGVVIALNNIGDKKEPTSLEAESLEVVGENMNEDAVQTSPAAKVVVSTDVDLSLPYTEALVKYAGRLMQFDSRCMASPAKSSFEAGTKVMLDNRGLSATRVTVGDQAFEIPAYNFAFLTVEAEKTPTTYAIDCGAKKGVASITVTE